MLRRPVGGDTKRYRIAAIRSFVFPQLALSVLSVVLLYRIVCLHLSLEAGLEVLFFDESLVSVAPERNMTLIAHEPSRIEFVRK